MVGLAARCGYSVVARERAVNARLSSSVASMATRRNVGSRSSLASIARAAAIVSADTE